jgi:preprotein translocase subunit SecG
MEVFVRFLLGLFLSLTALFLILLVLIQRGRGGGLAGALGGMGGQSAFGTKAGDFFTKFTVGVAAFWILLCILAINILGKQQTLFSSDLGSAAPTAVAPMAPQGQPPVTPPPAGAADEKMPPDQKPDQKSAEEKPAEPQKPAEPAAEQPKAAGTPPATEAAPPKPAPAQPETDK